MNQIIVGEKGKSTPVDLNATTTTTYLSTNLFCKSDCPINRIVDTIMKSPAATVLVDEWRKFARALHTPALEIKMYEKDVNLSRKTIPDILNDLLEHWKLREAQNARLVDLVEVLTNCGWLDLSSKF